MFWLSSPLAEFNASYVASELITKMAHLSGTSEATSWSIALPKRCSKTVIQEKQGRVPVTSTRLSADPQRDSETQQLPGSFFPKWRASLTGELPERGFSEAVSCWWTFWPTPCLSDAPWRDDRWSGVDRGRLCQAERQLQRRRAIFGRCARVCLVVIVQSGRSIPKTLSARIDFLFLDPWKRSCNTADPPRVALPCHFETRIKVKTSWK